MKTQTQESLLISMTKEEFVDWRHKQNAHIIFHRGHYWEEIFPGFYRPIHLLARLSAWQAKPPTRLSWGFHSLLCEDDAGSANGAIPVHLLSDIENYNLYSLKKNCRSHILKNYSLFRIVELMDTKILQEQGYEVYSSAMKRTQAKPLLSKKQYIAGLKDFVAPKYRLILAGFIGEKLCGYITSYAVNGTAYGEFVYIATEALNNNLNRILIFELVQACRRSGQIHEIFAGHHGEDRGITQFKKEMGFSVHHLPAKVEINPVIKKIIQWRYPDKYYRLGGQ